MSPSQYWEHKCKPVGLLWRSTAEICPNCGQHRPAASESAVDCPPPSALDVQEGGSHYKDLVIQPIEYIHANKIPFAEASVIKYVTRWRAKNGIDDLKKARHFLDLLIELETKAANPDK